MGTAIFPCGCCITTDMFDGKILSVHHCAEHFYLIDENKTLRQMADEMRDL
jgi:hypothetical protein